MRDSVNSGGAEGEGTSAEGEAHLAHNHCGQEGNCLPAAGWSESVSHHREQRHCQRAVWIRESGTLC